MTSKPQTRRVAPGSAWARSHSPTAWLASRVLPGRWGWEQSQADDERRRDEDVRTTGAVQQHAERQRRRRQVVGEEPPLERYEGRRSQEPGGCGVGDPLRGPDTPCCKQAHWKEDGEDRVRGLGEVAEAVELQVRPVVDDDGVEGCRQDAGDGQPEHGQDAHCGGGRRGTEDLTPAGQQDGKRRSCGEVLRRDEDRPS